MRPKRNHEYALTTHSCSLPESTTGSSIDTERPTKRPRTPQPPDSYPACQAFAQSAHQPAHLEDRTPAAGSGGTAISIAGFNASDEKFEQDALDYSVEELEEVVESQLSELRLMELPSLPIAKTSPIQRRVTEWQVTQLSGLIITAR